MRSSRDLHSTLVSALRLRYRAASSVVAERREHQLGVQLPTRDGGTTLPGEEISPPAALEPLRMPGVVHTELQTDVRIR